MSDPARDADALTRGAIEVVSEWRRLVASIALTLDPDTPGPARLMWQVRGWPGERMWVEVISRNGDDYTGWLKNDPVFVYASYGERIRFHTDHVLDIHVSESDIDPDEDLEQESDAA